MEPKKRKRGPDKYAPDQLRSKRLSVYVTEAELAAIEKKAASVGMPAPAFLREAGLDRLPPVIPAINQEAWADLARAAANLNQIIKMFRLEGINKEKVTELNTTLAEFRKNLIGVKK